MKRPFVASLHVIERPEQRKKSDVLSRLTDRLEPFDVKIFAKDSFVMVLQEKEINTEWGWGGVGVGL
jgi:hypothetical protein